MAQHMFLSADRYLDTYNSIQYVLKQVFRNGGISYYLRKPFSKDLVRRKEVMRLTDEYAVITEGAKYAFMVSGIKMGKKFKDDFGTYAISDEPYRNGVEVHTDEKGEVLAMYFVI